MFQKVVGLQLYLLELLIFIIFPELSCGNTWPHLFLSMQGNMIMSDIGLAEKRVYHAALNGNNSMSTVYHQKDE